jgi:hypothetical protein
MEAILALALYVGGLVAVHKQTACACACVCGVSDRTCNNQSCTYLVVRDVDLLDHFRDSILKNVSKA